MVLYFLDVVGVCFWANSLWVIERRLMNKLKWPKEQKTWYGRRFESKVSHLTQSPNLLINFTVLCLELYKMVWHFCIVEDMVLWGLLMRWNTGKPWLICKVLWVVDPNPWELVLQHQRGNVETHLTVTDV